MQIWIVKGYIKLRYFWRRGNLVVVCVTAYVTFYCHLISLFYSDFVILGRFSCRGIDLLDLKQNKCWYNSMRDLNFCICIGLRLQRGILEVMRYGNAAKREALCLQSICWILHHCLRYSSENYFLFPQLVRIKVLLPPFIWFISTILFGLFINVINVWLLINYSLLALFDITCKKKLPQIDVLWR